jgi:hypothetical protein
MEELPTDLQRGLDFQIIKTSKGGYADYSTSKWARKESALTEAEQAAVDQYGLFNLSDFLPKKPSEVELKVLKEMFEASVDGQAYDADKWGAYYKPYGLNVGTPAPAAADEDTPAPAAAAKPAPAVIEEDDEVPAATAPVQAPAADAKPSSQRAEDILAMIRSRQKQ